MSFSPSTTASNGANHTPDGKFAPGNKAARGNPHAQKVAKLRSGLLNSVSQKDLREVIDALLREAKRGNVQAAKELMDRVFGRAAQSLEVTEQPAGDNEPDPMTCDDMELARMIQAGGLELPKTLAEKVKRVEREQADSFPS